MINEYLLFVTLAVTITAIPGPAVILTIKNSVTYGFEIAMAGILGNFTAMVIMAAISALGLGAIILASSILFTAVKVIGGIYLIYLGIKAWKSPYIHIPIQNQSSAERQKSFIAVYKKGVLVGMSNPKAIAFFTALFPQFIDPAMAFVPQFLTLILTLEGISCLVLTIYAILASKATRFLCRDHIMRQFGKLTGGAFIGFGVALLSDE